MNETGRSGSTRRQFLQAATAAGAMAALPVPTPAMPAKPSAGRPNIVLLVADDMGYSDLGCFGSEIRTPTLDRLAAGGLRFSQFYNSPRCCPSRAALLTGLYSHQAGMGMMTSDFGRYPYPAYRGDLSEHCTTLAEALRSGGYRTLMTGKWHLTPWEDRNSTPDRHNWPLQRGFDRFYGIIGGAADFYDPATLVRDNEPIREQAADFYLTDAIADNAVHFLQETAGTQQPFFLYTAFNAPHWPLQAPEPAVAQCRDRYHKGWDRLRADRHAQQVAMGLLKAEWALTPRDPRVPAWERASFKAWEVERMAVYAAQVELMDRAIGRMVEQLQHMGVLENTLVLFLSDNGGNYEEFAPETPGGRRPIYIPERTRDGSAITVGNLPSIMPGPPATYQSYGGPWGNVSNTPFRLYKHFAHEGGISTPMIAHWPAGIVDHGRITHEITHEIDIMATCLAASGTPYPTSTKAGGAPPPLEGKNLVPVLQGGAVRERGMLFWEHEGNCAVRDNRWKLVSSYPDTWELYDMEADRTELRNLASEQPERVNTLAAAYRAWAQRVGAQPWPMPQTPPGERGGMLPAPDYLRHDRT